MAIRYANPVLEKEYEESPKVKLAKKLAERGTQAYSGGDPWAYGIGSFGDILSGHLGRTGAEKEFSEKEKVIQEALAAAMTEQDPRKRAEMMIASPYLRERGEKLSDEELEFQRQQKLASLQSVLGTQATGAQLTMAQNIADIAEQEKAIQAAKQAQTGLGTYDPETKKITGGAYEMAGARVPTQLERFFGATDPRVHAAAQLKASTGIEYKPEEISQRLVASALSGQQERQRFGERKLGFQPKIAQLAGGRQYALSQRERASAALPPKVGRFETIGF